MSKKYLIIYHKDDNDGVLSGSMFVNYLTDVLKVSRDEIETYGADYNMLAEFSAKNKPAKLHEKYENLIITDISFGEKGYMRKLYDEFGHKMVWCDHHAPIIKESFSAKNGFSNIPGERLVDRSAILCAYKFLYDPLDKDWLSNQIPKVLDILSAWDSWTYTQRSYSLELVRDVNKGLTFDINLELEKMIEFEKSVNSFRQNISSMDADSKEKICEVSDSHINRLKEIGCTLNIYDDINATNNVRDYGDLEWKIIDEDSGDRKACALFIQGASNSQMFRSLIGTNIRHGIVLKHQKNSNWTLSLYNVNEDEDFHCGEFLKKKYGGGGHKGAAGCTLTEKQFIEVLQNRSL